MKDKRLKLKIELRQTKTKLEGARNGVVNLVELNAQTTINKYKKCPGIQEFLNTYEVGSFNLSYDDMWRFLIAKHHYINKSFVDVMQKAFIEGKELDFTPIEPTNIVLTSITPVVKLPLIITPLGDRPLIDVFAELIILSK